MPESTALPIPSTTVLDEIPARALKMMGAISNNPYIRATLALRGYTEATHELGWQLVLNASGYRRSAPNLLDKPEAAAAIAALDAWDEPNFRVARGALVLMREQHDFLFQDLEAQTGPAAIASVATFLDRCDELETSKERKTTRKADLGALDKLAERGIHKAERERLRTLLSVATGSPAAANLTPKSPAGVEKTAEQREAKITLWAFHTEWSEIAKADIKRRDHLIQLGLGKRKTPKKDTKAESSEGNEGSDK